MPSININNIPGDNKTINSLGSQITVVFNPPIILDRDKQYEMALNTGSIVYCNPNVINRYLRFTYKNTDYEYKLDDGIYSIDALNIAFANQTGALFPPKGLFQIEALNSTAQCAVFFIDYSNTQLSFVSNNDNIMDLLGFVPTSSKFQPVSIISYALSQGKCVLNNISQFVIGVDCIMSNYDNSQNSNILCSIPIDVAPFQTQRIAPFNLVFGDIYKYILNSITLTLNSELGTPIDMTCGHAGTTTPELFAVELVYRVKKD